MAVYYITANALVRGIIKTEPFQIDCNWLRFSGIKNGLRRGTDAFLTLDEANADVRRRIARRRQLLERHISKLNLAEGNGDQFRIEDRTIAHG